MLTGDWTSAVVPNNAEAHFGRPPTVLAKIVIAYDSLVGAVGFGSTVGDGLVQAAVSATANATQTISRPRPFPRIVGSRRGARSIVSIRASQRPLYRGLPQIVLCTFGAAEIVSGGAAVALSAGQASFVPAAAIAEVHSVGGARLFVASVSV